jgi:hypothetical protein
MFRNYVRDGHLSIFMSIDVSGPERQVFLYALGIWTYYLEFSMVAQSEQWKDHGLKTVGSVFTVSERPDVLRGPPNLLYKTPHALSRVWRDQSMKMNSGVARLSFFAASNRSDCAKRNREI